MTSPRSTAIGALASLLSALLLPLAAGAAPACYSQDCDQPCAGSWSHRTTLVDGSDYPDSADTPLAFVDPGDSLRHRFVVTRQGKVWVWDAASDGLLPTPYLDLSAKVALDAGERGLLALAVDPEFAVTGHLYVFYTRSSLVAADHGDLLVERYTRASADAADPDSALEILVVDHELEGNHNGGWLAFGPDRMLYLSTGDGGGSCNPHGTPRTAQDLGSLLGKLLRLDVRGEDLASESPDCGPGGAYGVPSDNPYAGATAECGEIWAYGLRNPFRFSFDRAAGDLWIGDVGQSDWEEINFIPAAYAPSTSPTINFGWRCREGCETFGSGCDATDCPSALVGGVTTCGYPADLDPGPGQQLSWDPVLCHDNRNNSGSDWQAVIGGFRYRGSQVPSLAGRYLYGDAYCGQIWRSAAIGVGDPAATTASCWDAGNEGLYAFAEDEQGELYLVFADGRVECLHDGAGCPWAYEAKLFRDGFESDDTSAWSLTGDEPPAP